MNYVSERYSDISHIAHAHYDPNGVLVMLSFVSYFDASREEIKPKKLCVVAGYAASINAWEKFEFDWKLVLAKFNVPYFHMKEFTHFVGPYAEPCWKSESRRAEFIGLLSQITKGCTLVGVSRLLPQAIFDEANRKYKLSEQFNPFSICALACAVRVRTHLRKLYSDTAPIEYIFDQGDKGTGKLMNAMDKWGLPPPVFRHSKPVKNKPEIVPTVQLQCCDFAAWELRKANISQDDPTFNGYRKIA